MVVPSVDVVERGADRADRPCLVDHDHDVRRRADQRCEVALALLEVARAGTDPSLQADRERQVLDEHRHPVQEPNDEQPPEEVPLERAGHGRTAPEGHEHREAHPHGVDDVGDREQLPAVPELGVESRRPGLGAARRSPRRSGRRSQRSESDEQEPGEPPEIEQVRPDVGVDGAEVPEPAVGGRDRGHADRQEREASPSVAAAAGEREQQRGEHHEVEHRAREVHDLRRARPARLPHDGSQCQRPGGEEHSTGDHQALEETARARTRAGRCVDEHQDAGGPQDGRSDKTDVGDARTRHVVVQHHRGHGPDALPDDPRRAAGRDGAPSPPDSTRVAVGGHGSGGGSEGGSKQLAGIVDGGPHRVVAPVADEDDTERDDQHNSDPAETAEAPPSPLGGALHGSSSHEETFGVPQIRLE